MRASIKVRRRVVRKRLLLIMLVLFILAACFTVALEYSVRPVLLSLWENSARTMAINAMNDSIDAVLLEENLSYDDFVLVSSDNDGQITAITTDSVKLNQIKNKIELEIDSRLYKTASCPIDVPMGVLTGTDILAGRGRSMTFYVSFTGTATSELSNDFVSGGINQTIHRIMLTTTASMYSVSLRGSETFTVENTSCIAETVIVGETPSALLTQSSN